MSKTAGLGSWAPHIPEVSAIYAEKAGNANKNLAIYYYTLSVFHARRYDRPVLTSAH